MLRNNSIIEGKLENIVDTSKLGREGGEGFHLHRPLYLKSQELQALSLAKCNHLLKAG